MGHEISEVVGLKCVKLKYGFANPGGSSTPPSICGSNSNEHMYVDSSDQCNELSMLLGTTAVGTTIPTRSWTIRVTQLECGSDNLPPAGCTQYFFGSDTGTVKTYNYDGGYHLGNQNQVQCIRREKGNCKICYAATALADFGVSGGAAANMFVTKSCCSYGPAGVLYYDCLNINGLSKSGGTALIFSNGICGLGGLASSTVVADTTGKQKTLCTKRQPFQLEFQSDNWETTGNELTAANTQIGYKLAYTMSSSC